MSASPSLSFVDVTGVPVPWGGLSSLDDLVEWMAVEHSERVATGRAPLNNGYRQRQPDYLARRPLRAAAPAA